jgi:beta-lactamase class A
VSPRPIPRRHVLSGAAALAAGALFPGRVRAQPALDGLAEAFAAIEARAGGRLGVAVIETGNGATAGHRTDERFALCSTFKLLLAAAVLKQVELGRDSLDRRIPFTADQLVHHSPVTGRHAGGAGLTLEELCAAAVTVSDNTAGNLLLVAAGGPPGLTAFVRALGDSVTRFDRIEPDLNEATPGDPRDTTSPAAMAADVAALVLGDALAPDSRERLKGWLLATTTGADRLAAGLPDGWRLAHKTGTGGHGSTNDVGVLWPPQDRPPVVVAAYLTESVAPLAERTAALAAVAEAVAAAIG